MLRPLFITLFRVPRLTGLVPWGPAAVITFTVLATIGSLLVAVVSWHCYEQPFLRLKRFLAPRGASGPSGAFMVAPANLPSTAEQRL
jgi:peptidoglycan/LPS O-acetylase OafA/YrhL